MYDLIYTNAEMVEQGALDGYVLTMTYGDTDNDFDCVFGTKTAPPLTGGCLIFVEGTEYGGIVRYKDTSTKDGTTTYRGSTWHGVMNEHYLYPPQGQTHLKVAGDAHEALRAIIANAGLEKWFKVADGDSGISVQGEFRYAKAYDSIASMLARYSAKLKIAWRRNYAELSVVEAHEWATMNEDNAQFTIKQGYRPPNHMLLLGKGEMLDRDIGDLYMDSDGNVTTEKHFFGVDEVMCVYEDTNSEGEELRAKGAKKLLELQNTDDIDVSSELVDDYDVGDYVTVANLDADQKATAVVSCKTVTLEDGEPTFSCEIGSASALFDLTAREEV